MKRKWRIRFWGKRRPVPVKRAKPRSKRAKKWLAMPLLLAFLAALGYGYYRFDRRILPLALSMADMKYKTVINNAIYTAVQGIIQERGVRADDFYMRGGDGQSLTVNTVLVNDLCNASALRISETLSTLAPEPISVPIGMALGLDTLAYWGPRISFELSPIGNALVDYESRIGAVGINQVHFEVWLTVESTVRIINPAQSSSVTVTRDVSLVDTVTAGAVPDLIMDWDVMGNNPIP